MSAKLISGMALASICVGGPLAYKFVSSFAKSVESFRARDAEEKSLSRDTNSVDSIVPKLPKGVDPNISWDIL